VKFSHVWTRRIKMDNRQVWGTTLWSFSPRLSVVMLWLTVLVASTLQVSAQSVTSGDIVGVVADPSGAVLPNVSVTLKSNAKGNMQVQSTNSHGTYRFSLLAPGSYTVSVAAPGFQEAMMSGVVTIGQATTLNIVLSLGGATSTVEVTSDAPLLQTENADVSTSFSQTQISQVPNPGNDLSYVAQTAPGVIQNTQGGNGNFSAYGLPATSNLFTVNGQNENDPFLNLNNSGATNLLLGNNDVQEATVVTNGYSGEYGTLAGANVNYVTKSGGNSFHGNALYWWNGRVLNANSYFNNQNGTPRPFVNANQWAASIGGPIKKDKTFFFVDTEGLRFVLPTSTNVRIPSSQFETATLANLASVSPASVPFYQQLFNLYNNAPGASRAANILPGGGCGSFSLPGGGPCALQFNSTVGQLSTEWLLTVRVDQNLGNNDRLFGHFRTDHGFQATVTDAISPLFNLGSRQPQYEGQLEETHSLGANAVNQFIASGQYYSALFDLNNLQAAQQALPFRVGFSGTAFSPLGRFLGIVPQGRNVSQYQFVDDFSIAKGNHSLKFGISFRRNNIGDFDPGIGSIGASNSTTLSSFFNGDGGVYFQSFPSQSRQPVALYDLGFYGQDEWHIKPNLKLTFSLRGEHFSDPLCQTNCFAHFSGDFFNISHDPNQPYNQAIVSGQHQVLPNYTAVEWLPRFGFSWTPFGLHNTVVRGGFGLFADSFPGNIADQLLSNPPLQVGFNIAGGPLSPDVANNQAQLAAQSNAAFRAAFANGGTLASIQNSVPGFTPPTFNTVASRIQNPRYQEWNLELQQLLGQKTSLTLNYVGNHGVHEVVQNPGLNAFCDQGCQSALNNGNPPTVSQFGSLPTSALDPRFSTVTETSSSGDSNYNGLTLSVVRHTTNLTVQGNYTWSHAQDDISNGGLLNFNNTTNFSILAPIDPFNLRRFNYGNSDYDTRHYLSVNYVYNVPHKFGPSALLEGWTVAGTVFARSGQPFTVVDSNAYGILNGENYGIAATSSVPAQVLGGGRTCTSQAANPATPCLLASDFAFATTGFGEQRRNQFTGPRFFNTDFTVTKMFKVPHWESAHFGVGAQFFNIFNHPHFDQPDADIASQTFGRIINPVASPTSIFGSFLGADASPRLVQLHATFTF
jgi:Carboxypeptidase regulatory-like domain/TonB dependent receptor-like, beta-barrel